MHLITLLVYTNEVKPTIGGCSGTMAGKELKLPNQLRRNKQGLRMLTVLSRYVRLRGNRHIFQTHLANIR